MSRSGCVRDDSVSIDFRCPERCVAKTNHRGAKRARCIALPDIIRLAAPELAVIVNDAGIVVLLVMPTHFNVIVNVLGPTAALSYKQVTLPLALPGCSADGPV